MKIEIVGLKHRYPSGSEALQGIDLLIEGTSPVAIIGQNGAGKTTLVKHLNGILTPSAGQILLDGQNVETKSMAQWSKHIGYVFQNPDDQLFLETVKKEFEFGPKQIGMSREKWEERLKWVAELVGLSEKLSVHPFDLNAAEKKFCTIGAVLMMNPQVIIFDEPTCGQDLFGNQRLQKIIKTLKKQGILCITISHDMKFVVKNFHRVIVMCQGGVLVDDSTEKVFMQPELLKKSFIVPPPITKVAQEVGFEKAVFTTKAFMEVFEERRSG